MPVHVGYRDGVFLVLGFESLVFPRYFNILGVKEKIKCEVQQFDLSAHADHNELLDFINGCDPEKIVLCHSDNREALAKDLEADHKVFLPKLGEEFEL